MFQTQDKENLLHNKRKSTATHSATLQIWNHTLIHDLFICYCSAGCCICVYFFSSFFLCIILLVFFSYSVPLIWHFLPSIIIIVDVGISFGKTKVKHKEESKQTTHRLELNRWFLQTHRSLWCICEKEIKKKNRNMIVNDVHRLCWTKFKETVFFN